MVKLQKTLHEGVKEIRAEATHGSTSPEDSRRVRELLRALFAVALDCEARRCIAALYAVSKSLNLESGGEKSKAP